MSCLLSAFPIATHDAFFPFLRYISASVTDDTEINEVMEFIVKDSGTESMDVCVCAAGVLGTYDALEYPVEDFKRVSGRGRCCTTRSLLTSISIHRSLTSTPLVFS